MNNLKPYKNYKSANIAWLGDIPEHWEVRKLKFLINGKLKYGANESGGDFQENDPRYIRITDFNKVGKLRNDTFCSLKSELAKPYLLKNGDILFARSGATVGKTFQFKNYIGDACYAGYLIKAEPNLHFITSDYLYQFTCSGVYNIWKNFIFNKATIENIGADKYCNLLITLPPLTEQLAIANFLDYKLSKIDRFIQKKKQLIKLLNEQKAGIINDAVTKGLNPNANMKPSGIDGGDLRWLGDIPEHWEVRKLKYVANFQSGEMITSETISPQGGEYPVFGGGGFRGYTNNYTNDGSHILIGRQGALCGNIKYANGKFWASEHSIVTYPKIKVKNIYLGEILTLCNLGKLSQTAAQPGIAIGQIKNVSVPIPPFEEQTAIVQYIEKETAQINLIIQTIEKEIALTQEYRVALIAEAVTGKIDVREYAIPETPIVELYEELEEEMSLAAEDEVGYGIDN